MGNYTYDDWSRLLADFFFDSAHAGEEILFAVDDRSLAEASGLPQGEAADSLSKAVRSVVGPDWLLGSLIRRVARWRQDGAKGPHPALPFLALTVLAASRMGEHESIAPHNYYLPLRQLLDPRDTQKGAPGSFTDHVGRLWHDLQRWANDDLHGCQGRIVVRDPPYFPYVGLGIQHALLKSSDLRRLDDFFRRIGLEPGEELSAGELRRALSVWTAGRSEPWARRLRRISTDPALIEYCEALLTREASRWDGRARDPRTGRPIGRIRLGLSSLRRPEIGLFVEWDTRLPQSIDVVLPSGNTTTLTERHGWYEPHPLDGVDVTRSLAGGLELRAGVIEFHFPVETVYALAYNDDLGAWVSVDTMSYGDRYHLIVERDSAADVLRFAQQESGTAPRLDDLASRSLPVRWKLIRDVQLDARPKMSPPSSLAPLVRAGASPRIRLLGGLPIGPAQGSYLRGGEPALALSSLSEGEHILIRRESTGDVEQIRVPDSADREIPLWPFQLVPDSYEVEHGESSVRLQIIDGIAEAAGPGAGTIQQRGRDGIDVVGTQTSLPCGPRRDPITVPAPSPASEVILLGPRADHCMLVELPLWLSLLVGFELSWVTTDAWPDFEPAWCLKRGPSGRYEATMLHDIEPDAPQRASATRWGRLIAVAVLRPNEPEAAASLWDRYRKGAGAAP